MKFFFVCFCVFMKKLSYYMYMAVIADFLK
jgi:hypothetical protein